MNNLIDMKVKNALSKFFILVVIISNISCDQILKSIVRQRVEYNSHINLISNYVILTRVENTGAFLGLGDSIPRPLYKIIMIILPIIVLSYALFFLFTKENISKLLIIGLSFIIAGGIGNIFDRIVYGSVTDFIHIDFIIFKTGILNLADISVTTGFIIIMYEFYIKWRKHSYKTIENKD
jgi:signal peptidase II